MLPFSQDQFFAVFVAGARGGAGAGGLRARRRRSPREGDALLAKQGEHAVQIGLAEIVRLEGALEIVPVDRALLLADGDQRLHAFELEQIGLC